MNKKAQESIQQLPTIDHPSHKKLIIMAIVTIVIIALAITAFVVFNKNRGLTLVETQNVEEANSLDIEESNSVIEGGKTPEQITSELSETITQEQKNEAERILASSK